jgi:hypothetical protein
VGEAALLARSGVDPGDLEVAREAARANAEHEPAASHVVKLDDPMRQHERIVATIA